MRLALVVFAACAAALAASDSSAADAPPKAESSKPLRLRLEAGKTYLYRLRETVVIRMAVLVEGVEGIKLEERAEVEWDVGVSLQRVERGGDSIVSLMPTRVRGTITELGGGPEPIDSEDPKSPVTSPLLGRGVRVRLSPRGRVLEAAGPGVSPVAGLPPDVQTALARLGGDFARPFTEQFFHELPEAAPRKDLAWQQSRALAPEWTLWDRGKDVRGRCLGDVNEQSVVQTLSPESVTATVRARGKSDAPRRVEPLDADKMKLADIGSLGDQLDEWLVAGEVRIRRDTGLILSRTATCTLETHQIPIRFSKNVRPPILPGLEPPAGEAVTDRTHEITLQLDLVDVR
jgi:hypothetical protein